MVQGTIFDIQTYSLHDGPGIRTPVFLKGCPLNCVWCQNPESQRRQPDYYSIRRDAPAAANVCRSAPDRPSWCQMEYRILRETSVKAAEVCADLSEYRPNTERQDYVSKDVFTEVKKDEAFYRSSGGGITLSGGEPLAQPEFSTAILRCANELACTLPLRQLAWRMGNS